MSGEASSRAFVELPGSQRDLALAVIRAAQQSTGGAAKPVVVVLMNGRALAIPELARDGPAIVESWFLGGPHGPGGADGFFGGLNPGGKVPRTFPRATGPVSDSSNHP